MTTDEVELYPNGVYNFEDLETSELFQVNEIDLYEFLLINNEVEDVEEFNYKMKHMPENDLYELIENMRTYYKGKKDSPIHLLRIMGKLTSDTPPPSQEPHWMSLPSSDTINYNKELNILTSDDVNNEMDDIGKELDDIGKELDELAKTPSEKINEDLERLTSRLIKLTAQYASHSSLKLDGHPTIENLLRGHEVVKVFGRTFSPVNCSENWLRFNINSDQIKTLMIEEKISIQSDQGAYTLKRIRTYL